MALRTTATMQHHASYTLLLAVMGGLLLQQLSVGAAAQSTAARKLMFDFPFFSGRGTPLISFSFNTEATTVSSTPASTPTTVATSHTASDATNTQANPQQTASPARSVATTTAASTAPETAPSAKTAEAGVAGRRGPGSPRNPPRGKPTPPGSNALSNAAFDQTVDDAGCISEPEEFIKAWRSPIPSDRDRCVDPSIIVRLANGDRKWNKLEDTLKGLFGRLSPVSFWAFKSAPEKYLRIGQPQTVGAYTDGNSTTPLTPNGSLPFDDPEFPGIRDSSNGVSMLTQIGFGSDFYRVDKFYMMFVGKRNKRKLAAAGVPTFVPTWDNVRVYYEHYIRDFISKQNGTMGIPEAFVIPKAVTEGGPGFQGLANIELSALTGCPSQCTYEDTIYPYEAADAVSSNYPAVTPGLYANHTKADPEKCDPPAAFNGSADIGSQLLAAGRFKLSEPTQLAVNELLCTDPDWKRYYLTGDFPSTPTWERVNGTVIWTGNKFPGLYEICRKESKFPGPLFIGAFLNEWNKLSATDYRKKAVLFRAFLMAGCAGNFNQLFSGNGLIYTGHGGVSSATVHEVLLGAIAADTAEPRITGQEQLLGNVAYSFFCIDGTQNCCPDNNCKTLGKPAWA